MATKINGIAVTRNNKVELPPDSAVKKMHILHTMKKDSVHGHDYISCLCAKIAGPLSSIVGFFEG